MTNKEIVRLCEQFDYPFELGKLINQILDYILDNSKIEIESVVLIGSISRGEFSYLRMPAGLILFSDLEFLIVTKERVSWSAVQHIRSGLERIEAELKKTSRLFHIDVSFLPLHSLSKLRGWFLFVESGITGRVIYGRNVLNLFPKHVTDIKQIRDATVERLWTVALFVPRSCLLGNPAPQEELEAKYLVARCVLDLLCWLLSYTGLFLPTIEQRVRALLNNYEALDLGRFLPDTFPELVEEAWTGKRELRFKRGFVPMCEDLLKAFDGTLRYAVHKSGGAPRALATDELAVSAACRLFKDCQVKHKGWELSLALKQVGATHPLRLFRWVVAPKRGIQGAIAYSLLTALSLIMQNRENEASDYLQRARKYLDRLAVVPSPPREGDAKEQWLDLRKRYVDHLIQFYPEYAQKRGYIYRALDQ
mgnify:CR=1 FL=1